MESEAKARHASQNQDSDPCSICVITQWLMCLPSTQRCPSHLSTPDVQILHWSNVLWTLCPQVVSTFHLLPHIFSLVQLLLLYFARFGTALVGQTKSVPAGWQVLVLH